MRGVRWCGSSASRFITGALLQLSNGSLLPSFYTVKHSISANIGMVLTTLTSVNCTIKAPGCDKNSTIAISIYSMITIRTTFVCLGAILHELTMASYSGAVLARS